MNRIQTIGLLSVLLAATGAAQAQGPAERVGGIVGGALDQTGRILERSVRRAVAVPQSMIERMEVSSRVFARLHWDKTLVGSRVSFEVLSGGVIVLTGVVPNEPTRDAAIRIVVDTIGVAQVVDELQVLSPPGVRDSSAPGFHPGLTPLPRPGEPALTPPAEPLPAPSFDEPVPEPEAQDDPPSLPLPTPMER